MYREIDGTHPKYDNLVFYYKLNQTSGIRVIDSMGGNDGSTFNMSDSNWVDSDVRGWTVNAGETLNGRLVGSYAHGSSTNGTDWNLTFEIVTQGSKGRASITGDNEFKYVADHDKHGGDSFTYKIKDPEGNDSNVQTVNIDIVATKYTVAFDSSGGSAVDGQTVSCDEKATEPGVPTKTGYTFDGWFDASTGGSKITSIPQGSKGNKTLYARWTPNTNTAYRVEHTSRMYRVQATLNLKPTA